MIKYLTAIVSSLFFMQSISAQDIAEQQLKDAGKALATFNLKDTDSDRLSYLESAKGLINSALESSSVQAKTSAWLLKGDIYYTLCEYESVQRLIKGIKKVPLNIYPISAWNAYLKGYQKADAGSKEKRDALTGIASIQQYIFNAGAGHLQEQDMSNAFMHFNAVMRSHDLLKTNNQKSLLDDSSTYKTAVYAAAVSAQSTEHYMEAINFYNDLYFIGNASEDVYEGLYNTRLAMGNIPEADRLLIEGRAKYPDNAALLFAQINVNLKNNKLNETVPLLKTAIGKEPENTGLYLSLGQVYDNLEQKMTKANNKEKATEYFREAKKYYAIALEKDAKNLDAAYSLGTMHYNKASLLSSRLGELSSDKSETVKKATEILEAEMLNQFEMALPYFQKAESIDPNDAGTLTALYNIYIQKISPLADEFKKRKDLVKNGGKNSVPYFSK